MKRLRTIAIVIQRVSITLSVFWAAMVVIQLTSITPKAILSPCDRPCNRADWPRICRYRLIVEKRTFGKFSVDHKSIISDDEPAVAAGAGHFFGSARDHHHYLVNGKHTGPTLNVCENDFIVIDVENRIPGQSISIHWTGQSQRHTPFMDGVPIFTTFQYKFQADRVGTHLYHGFSSEERSLGLVGALLVHSVYEQSKHPLTSNHQGDIVWILSETNGNVQINGKRRMAQYVKPAASYRLRVAYMAPVGQPECERWLEIENHRLTVIALDGNLIKPFLVDRIALSDGGRVDLLVRTTGMARDYAIRITTGDDIANGSSCAIKHERFRLKYIGSRATDLQNLLESTGRVAAGTISERATLSGQHQSSQLTRQTGFNSGRTICAKNTAVNISQGNEHMKQQVCLLDTRSNHAGGIGRVEENFPLSLHDTDRQINLVISKHKVVREMIGEQFHEISYSVNGFSFIFPSVLMLSNLAHNELTLHLCSNHSGDRRMPRKCHQLTNEPCECAHVEHIETGHRVELVLINEDPDSDHSYHLHGHRFFLLAASRCDKGCTSQLPTIRRNFDRPVQRDTIKITKRSLVVLRFVADHSGLWMLRDLGAHPGWSRGLDVLLSVGGAKDAVINLPEDFPSCRNFIGPKYFLI
ncbi:uncharacterized protein LOC131436742 isoform X2 [Malaya genurostris]|uniref:uncharacterized protein LOC131436742 isoform X2 n=1 Tax=Malaya genurostris TaxID=325434 RepID=UPI0026F3AC1C|nr:uncharacterized protein LOC131436742 isoform X2 [Malaya genurostris]